MYCLHQLSWAPGKFLALSPQEQAFVIAAIDIKIEREQKEQAKMNRRKGRKR